jgi:hypothetical protein
MSQPQLVYSKETNVEIATIATSAVLLDLHVSTWTGRKRDKKTSAEVNKDKQTTSDKAASVIKNLMADDKELDAIKAYAQDTRIWLQRHTMAWSDSGTRLLPSALIFEVTSELEARITEFDRLCGIFLAGYATKVSAAAFKLGQLFDRSEFPAVDEVQNKFGMRFVLTPVPTAGDFRVDVQKDTGEFLKKQFQKEAEQRVTAMMREPWERAYESLAHLKERMETALAYEPQENEDGRRRPKLFQSLVDNGLELAALLEKLNISNDPQLADCAARMRRMLSPLDMRTVRESKEMQESVKKQVEDILGTFDFGLVE